MELVRPSGFTLIEAVIALAIGGALVAVAVPAWTGAIHAAHAGAARSALLESMTRAIGHAGIVGVEVVLCPGDDTAGCRASTDWSQGWIAYADLDGNRQRGPHETLLHAQPALPDRVHLRTTTGRTRLVFQPNGGNAGSNATFTLCDGRGPAQATTLVLANNGRLRAGTPTAAAAEACVRPPL